MRVYRKPEFLALPEGTIYCRGKKWYFDGITIKGETVSDKDWFELDPAWVDGDDSPDCFDRLEEMLNAGASYPMQDSVCRNGSFEDDDLFLVFEKPDLEKLRGWIDVAVLLQGGCDAMTDRTKVNGFAPGAAPKCVFCGADWTEDMIMIYDIDASHGHGSYDFGPEDQKATLEISCSSCNRLIYIKEHGAS